MILEEFDNNRNAVLNPNTFHKPLDNMPKTCVSFFSKTMSTTILLISFLISLAIGETIKISMSDSIVNLYFSSS